MESSKTLHSLNPMILKWRTSISLDRQNQKALLCVSSLLALLPIAPSSVVILVGTFPSPFQIVPFLAQSQLLVTFYLKRSFFFPHSNKVSVSWQLAGPQEVPVKQLYEDLHLRPIIPANMMKWNNVCLFIFFPTKLINNYSLGMLKVHLLFFNGLLLNSYHHLFSIVPI